jgi:hypothetical protein
MNMSQARSFLDWKFSGSKEIFIKFHSAVNNVMMFII